MIKNIRDFIDFIDIIRLQVCKYLKMLSDLLYIKDYRNYWKYLIIIGAYYALPSLQFVIFQEITDDQDLCYFNEKCMFPVGNIDAFNNVISNIFYCIYAITFIGIVKYNSRKRLLNEIDSDPSIYYALGTGLFLEGIFSGIFHVCPSALNFQFDTTFMFFGIALSFLALYQKRHPKELPSAFRTYMFLSIVVLLNLLPLLDSTIYLEVWSWIFFYILTVYVLISGTIHIYFGELLYSNNLNNSKNIFQQIKIIWRSSTRSNAKLALVFFMFITTISLMIVAQVNQHIFFTNWVLALFTCNMLVYYLYYIIQKILHKEWVSIWKCLSMIICLSVLSTALVVFEIPVTDKLLPHNESNALNKPCVLFDYWDYHDLWHILSATGLFMFLCNIYFLDTDTQKLYNEDNPYPIF